MASADDISDVDRNEFLDQPTTKKETSDKKTSIFHDFPNDLQITAIMCALQEAPDTRQSNTNDTKKGLIKQDRNKLVKGEGFEKATYGYIQCLIYRQMWDSDWRWKTSGEVKKS